MTTTSTTPRPRQRRAVVAVGPLLLRVRREPALLLLVAGIVIVVSFAAALLPRALERAAGDALVETIATADPSARGLVGEEIRVVPARRVEPMEGLRATGVAAWEGLPAGLSTHLEPPRSLVDSIRYALVPLEGGTPLPLPTFLTLRAHEGIEEHLELVEGRLPRITDDPRADPGPGAGLVEVLLTPETSAEIGMGVGDELLGVADVNDPVVRRRSFDEQLGVTVRVVGLAELSDPDDPFWFGDARLHRPAQQETGTGVNLFPFAILTSEGLRSHPDVLAGIPLRMEFRSLLAAERLSPAAVLTVRDEVRRIEAGVTSEDGTRWRTGLGRLLDGHLSRVAGARAAVLVTLTGVLSVALVVVGLVGVLLAVRRRPDTALVRGRGATAGQLLLAQATEGAALVLPAAAIGFAVAGGLLPGTGAAESLRLVAIAAVLAMAALTAAALPDARRPLRDVLEADADRRTGVSLRRRTAEGAVVLVTVGAVVALRRRGVAVGEAVATDPLLLLTPVLLATAAAVLLVRVHRLPLRVAGLVARDGRGAAAMVGLARAARTPRTGAPLAVLLIATSVAVVALAMDGSVRQGQVAASWGAVGAAYRLDAAPGDSLPPVATDDLPGATDIARETRVVAPVVAPAAVAGRVDIAMVELDRYARLTADTPAAVDLPLSLLTAAPIMLEGSEPAPVPALVSRSWARGSGVGRDDVVTILLGDALLDVRVVGTRTSFGELGEGTRGFLVLPLTHVEAALGRSVGTERLYVEAPVTAAADIAGVADELGAAMLDRVGLLRGVRASPLVAIVLRTLRTAAGFALLLAGLALSAALAITGRRRGRDLSLLALLGGTRRQAAVAGLVEVLPAVVLAAVAGGALGGVTVVLLRRPLDLAPLTGDVDLALGLPSATIVVVAGATALLASALAATHALLARRTHPRTVLEEVDR